MEIKTKSKKRFSCLTSQHYSSKFIHSISQIIVTSKCMINSEIIFFLFSWKVCKNKYYFLKKYKEKHIHTLHYILLVVTAYFKVKWLTTWGKIVLTRKIRCAFRISPLLLSTLSL